MGAEQEVTFRHLLANSGESTLRALLDPAATKLLSALRPEALSTEHLPRIILGLGSVRDYLLSKERRAHVLGLLSIGQASLLAARANLISSANPHQSLQKASPSFSPDQLEAVLAFFGADDSAPPGEAHTPGTLNVLAAYSLFQHQRDVMRRVQERLYRGPRRVVLHMPTGSGKTRTAMNIIAEHFRAHEPTVVVWLACSQELLEQAASEFEAAWLRLGNRSVSIVRFWGNRKANLAGIQDGLVVAGLGKMYAASQRNSNLLPTLADSVSLVVMDEAHQSIAETYSFVLEILATKRRTTALLGLTATPGRTYSDIEQDARLSKFWSGEKVMLEVAGYENPVTYLISNGFLAKPGFRTVLANPGFDLDSRDIERLRRGLDLSDEVLDRLTDCQKWNTAVLDATRDLLSRHKRVIVFTCSVRQASILATVMRAIGTNARAVSGTTPRAEREGILQQFTSNSDEAMVIFNYGVLTTGFDAPATSAAVIARPTRSLVLFSQMAGRAMRGPRAGGNEHAEIVAVVDPALPGFGDPAQAFTNWEDIW